jgi:lipopolysaccharide export system protein LptA
MRWQRHARLGVAIFGIVFAIVVYSAIGERESAAPAARPSRLDPKAILESAGAIFQQFREARQDYVVEAERQMLYEGGASKLEGVTIKVRGREGRDFVVSAREAEAAANHTEIAINGAVTLTASDGFVVSAESATFNEEDAIITAPGPIAFKKGRMTGTGVGMSYDQANDVLTLMGQVHVVVKDEGDNTLYDFSSNSGTLARQEHYLALEGTVHVLRGDEVLEADRGTARLSDMNEFITFIELRGRARVSGGETFESLNARDIDLDYTDDGQTLERVVLTGKGVIAMRGADNAPGRRFEGESLDLTLAPDATLTRATGRQNVRIDLPPAVGAPARTITARDFDTAGEAGKGLTSARFTENVEFREAPQGGGIPRIARSQSLDLTLTSDEVTSASFKGRVSFEEQGLKASGENAAYNPSRGTLQLTGGVPRVEDDQVTVEGNTIEVVLLGRQMIASGNVKTTLRPRKTNESKLPGLLEEGQAATVNANALDYKGATGAATFSGRATLAQGQTTVRGNVLTLDQATGDLVASGMASSNLVFDGGQSTGRAAEITYRDGEKRIRYETPVPTGAARGAPATAVPLSQLNGPQGDLRAERIDVLLSADSRRVDRLEAYTSVDVRLDTRRATGNRLTYHADEERYVMTGLAAVPVTIVEACRETTGRTVTFFKSADRVIVDGNEESRTQSRRGGPCAQPAPSRVSPAPAAR